MKNLNHDLVQQTSELLDGIWRMDEYIKNAQADGCERCVNLWSDLKGKLEGHVSDLRAEIVKHVEDGMFD